MFTRNYRKWRHLPLCSLAALLALPLPALAGVDMMGSMLGNITGSVTGANGQSEPANGTANGDVAISTDANGNVSASVTGTVSCAPADGTNVQIAYNVSYDPATGNLNGNYTVPGNPLNKKLINFVKADGLNWNALISDNVTSSNGARLPYHIQVGLNLPGSALYNGAAFPAGYRFSGPLTTDLVISAPVNLPQYGLNTTINTTLHLDGQWLATWVPQPNGPAILTGSAQGTYSSGTISLAPVIKISNSLTYTPKVSFSLQGEFGGSLYSGDLQKLQFAGTYGETSNSQAQFPVTYNGGLNLAVPINPDGSITTMRLVFQGQPTVNVDYSPITIPISVSGSIPFIVQ